MATSGDLQLATTGDFLMATDKRWRRQWVRRVVIGGLDDAVKGPT